MNPRPAGQPSTRGSDTGGTEETRSETQVGDRLRAIEERIVEACTRSGRDREEVTLVGASKRQPLERLRAAFDAGLRVFGENRVQEAERKRPLLDAGAQWHLLGPLQSNKIRRAVGLFSLIHSVDRLRIAELLSREATARGLVVPCLLEVNLAGEPTKHGFRPDELATAVETLANLPGLALQGLMAIPPPEKLPEEARRWFRALRRLRDQHHENVGSGLSMGMSRDFAIAIEEGATWVRVGNDLFGARPESNDVPH